MPTTEEIKKTYHDFGKKLSGGSTVKSYQETDTKVKCPKCSSIQSINPRFVGEAYSCAYCAHIFNVE